MIVVGAGVGGLAAAIRLAALGNSVTLCEKNPRTGGKLDTWSVAHPSRPEDRPFNFDPGPGLLTQPLVFADLFAAAGADVRDHLQITRLNPLSRFIWSDGTELALSTTSESVANCVRSVFPEDEIGLKKLLARGESAWNRSAEFILSRTPGQTMRGDGAFCPANALKMLTLPLRLGFLRKYAGLVDAYVKSPRLRDVLYHFIVARGLSPFAAPAVLGVIPYVELELGGWYVQGGMVRLAEALESLARSQGVDIRLQTPVRRVIVESSGRRRRTTGVETEGGEILSADAVVVNADLPYAYRSLLNAADRPTFPDARLDALEPGGSGFVLLLGIEGTYPQLAHHTRFMPDDYVSAVRAVFEQKRLPDEPWISVCAPARTDPTQAPDGCEVLTIVCPAPPLDGRIDWSVEGPRYRDRIVAALEGRFGLADLSRRIVVERAITPADLRSAYNAHAGSFYGLARHGLRQTLLRPSNRDGTIDGLFFAGNSTHPGGGLPLVALSGKIASELVMEYLQ